MQHSVKEIGTRYERISKMREDKKRFNASLFLEFAKDNHIKYHLIPNGEDWLVSTWYSNDLINDYKSTIK